VLYQPPKKHSLVIQHHLRVLTAHAFIHTGKFKKKSTWHRTKTEYQSKYRYSTHLWLVQHWKIPRTVAICTGIVFVCDDELEKVVDTDPEAAACSADAMINTRGVGSFI
jgi:hypothetical protein